MNCICFQRSFPGGDDYLWSPRSKKAQKSRDVTNATAQGTLNTHRLKSFITTLKNLSNMTRCSNSKAKTPQDRPDSTEYISLAKYQIPEMAFEKTAKDNDTQQDGGFINLIEDFIQMESYDELICLGSTC
ncbi:hypothetical protein K7432_001085 [Basidiobolus ranarum]|uniref:Uncharacterized protein n=1 Tax=Basidiobolus ranarum TaxID=34480 RepID=A0ABR2X3M3_9FUNG